MTTLGGLNVEFTGDSKDLDTAAKQAKASIAGVGAQAQKTAQQQATATTKSAGMARGFSRLGQMSGRTQNQIRNVGFQVQDIAVQMSMGTDAMRVMSMQLPQLLGGFGTMGAVMGAVVGVTLPLVTAGMAALGAQTKTTAELMDDMSESIAKWQEATARAGQTNLELAEEFGGVNVQIRAILGAMEELSQGTALAAFDAGMVAATGSLDGLIQSLGGFREAQDNFGLSVALSSTSMKALKFEIGGLAGRIGLTADQTEILMPLLENLAEAKGPEEAAKAIGDLFVATEQIGVSFNDMNADATEFWETLGNTADAANMLTPPVMDAATATNILKEGFQLARAEMWQLQGEAPAAMAAIGDAVAGVAARVAGMFSGGGGADTPAATGGGGGVSAGEKAKQAAARALERLMAQMATETEALAAGHADQLLVLQDAFDNKLLSQEEFQDLSIKSKRQYEDAMLDMERQRRSASIDMASGLFGELAGLMSSENKKLFNIGKAAAIGEAVINTYRGISESLAQYPMPWAGAFAAAHAAVGFANVAKIKSTQFGGGGAGGGGGGGVTTPSVSDPSGGNSTLVNVSLQGDNFSRSGIRGLLDSINDVIGDGGRIRLT